MSVEDLLHAVDIRTIGRHATGQDVADWRARFQSGVWPFLLSREGGFSEAVTDAGGPTKYGVTWRTLRDIWQKSPEWCGAHTLPYVHPDSTADDAREAVRRLTVEQAFALAFIWYYARPWIARLPAPWDLACLDWRYNGGPAVQRLQRLCGLTGKSVDGLIGPQTLAEIAMLETTDLEQYINMRFWYLQSLHGPQGWGVNGDGWTVRLRALRKECLRQLEPKADPT